MKIKQIVYDVISGNRSDSKWNERFDFFMTALILLNVLAIALESYESFKPYEKQFYYFELLSVIIFSIEYLVRIWTANLHYKKASAANAVLLFVFSFFGLIDLLAILPFYLPMFLTLDLRFLRILRILRMLRVLKLSRHSKSLHLIGKVLQQTRYDLLATLFVTTVLLVLAATLVFVIEKPAQPDQFSNLGQAFWWAIATLTTVGYGDIYPITAMGKMLSGVIALLGIGLVAIPTGIISSAFVEEIQANKKSKSNDEKLCPHCGKAINE